MDDVNFISEFVYENLEGVKVTKGGTHFTARCPLCGDSKKSKSKKRFNLDFNNGSPVFHCWNCGRSGTFMQLYAELKGITIQEAISEVNRYSPEIIASRISPKQKEVKSTQPIIIEDHNYILKDCIGISDEPESHQQKTGKSLLKSFIEDRHIPENYDVFYAYKGKYIGRFIIPIYDENKRIIYFQARRSNEDMIPKYTNPDVSKANIILNRYKFDRSKFIVVTEGLIDAYMIGNQGTTSLGLEINGSFIETLSKLTDKGIIIALDNDKPGIKNICKYIESNNYGTVSYFLFPYKYREHKDINSFIVKEGNKDAYEFVVDNSYSGQKTYLKVKTEKWRGK